MCDFLFIIIHNHHSIFAAGSGADNVLGFEVSQTMCEIGNMVISANGLHEKISLLNEMSTSIMSEDRGKRLIFTKFEFDIVTLIIPPLSCPLCYIACKYYFSRKHTVEPDRTM